MNAFSLRMARDRMVPVDLDAQAEGPEVFGSGRRGLGQAHWPPDAPVVVADETMGTREPNRYALRTHHAAARCAGVPRRRPGGFAPRSISHSVLCRAYKAYHQLINFQRSL